MGRDDGAGDVETDVGIPLFFIDICSGVKLLWSGSDDGVAGDAVTGFGTSIGL